jgi:hypothetical protein
MSYSLSYHDGLETGARRERERIIELIMSEKHYGYHDMYDAQVLHNFTDLLESIEQGATDE